MKLINKVLKYIFRNAYVTNIQMDADELFVRLENAATENEYIMICDSMHDYGPEQIILRFLDKYKSFISFYYTDMSYPHGCMYIKLREKVSAHNQSGYAELDTLYNENYYMNDCGGYDVFEQSKGMEIEPRLQDVYNLVNPQEQDKILDVGCGRGELAFALATSGAKVLGVDYSDDAIGIAKKTYGGKLDNVQYVHEDIFKMDGLEVYDKIVMADVVEHIEQDVLEKIFEKISRSMSDRGVLIIHTAPNKDYYNYYYPTLKQRAAELGAYLPLNPRTYYEQVMHINEQNPEQLQKALEKFYKHVKVWTGSVMDIGESKTFEESCRDNQIFAYACNDLSNIEMLIQEISKPPQYEKCCVEFEIDDVVVQNKNREAYIDVKIKNHGTENLTSRRKFPINLSYHICDELGNVLEYDGERTSLSNFIRQNESDNIQMKLNVPRQSGTYRLCITLVAENCFWFDREGKNCKNVTLKVED